jgi:anti-sigma-K factor RskA
MNGAHEPYEKLAASFALGALDGEDVTRFRTHLAEGCARCEQLVLENNEGLALMAAEFRAAPPPIARERIMAWMGEGAAPAIVHAPPRRTARRMGRVLAWAASLLVAAGIGAWVGRSTSGEQYEGQVQTLASEANVLRAQLSEQGRTLAGLREQVSEQEATLASLRQKLTEQEQTLTLVRAQSADQERTLALLRDPATRLVTLDGLPASPQAQGRMLWHPETGGVFHVFNLPAPPEGKVYELWAISGKTPLPAGVFTVDASGRGTVPVAPLEGKPPVNVFAVTLEPAGGVPSPTGPMYLASKAA